MSEQQKSRERETARIAEVNKRQEEIWQESIISQETEILNFDYHGHHSEYCHSLKVERTTVIAKDQFFGEQEYVGDKIIHCMVPVYMVMADGTTEEMTITIKEEDGEIDAAEKYIREKCGENLLTATFAYPKSRPAEALTLSLHKGESVIHKHNWEKRVIINYDLLDPQKVRVTKPNIDNIQRERVIGLLNNEWCIPHCVFDLADSPISDEELVGMIKERSVNRSQIKRVLVEMSNVSGLPSEDAVFDYIEMLETLGRMTDAEIKDMVIAGIEQNEF